MFRKHKFTDQYNRMNAKLLLLLVTIVTSLFYPQKALAQAPNLGTTVNFVLFTSNGAVSNSGVSNYTGNVGAKIGAITGFGNVNGQIHAGTPAANQAATDLLIAYGQLDAAVPDSTAIIGNGDTLGAGTYYIPQPGTLNTTLFLDAKGNPNAVFIFQIDGTFGSNTSAKVKLLNGAQSCKVFWKVEGAVTLSVGTSIKGTIVANNGAITMNTNDTLDGRALSTTGAILMSGVIASTPIGCGSVVLNGPVAPTLNSTACYTIFSGNGNIINSGISNVTGDIGSNTGSASGFDSLLVIGKIHKTPDVSTATCSSDLTVVYNYLSTLPHDIELQSPALFGRDLVLTPHTYLLNSAAILTDTLYLDAQNNPDGVFVIKIVGALSTSTYARVKLLNGAQTKNIFWHVVGAVSINDYSIFCGTVVCSGAINLRIGSVLNGRALTTGGAINTVAFKAIAPPGCAAACPVITSEPIAQTVCAGAAVSFRVVATGDALTYQWRKGNVNLVNGPRITGAQSDTLRINPTLVADSASTYNVIVSGSCLTNDTSLSVALRVNTPPVITGEPANQLVCVGSQATFTATATGTNLIYKWRKGNVVLTNTGNISGVTSATLVINNTVLGDAAANYNVVISGACSPNDTSAFASLSFTTAPIITSEPVQKTVCVGASASFSVTSNGTGLTYLWRKGTTVLTNTGSITGVNTSTLVINPTTVSDAATNYNVIVIGACTPNDTSVSVALVVNPLPAAAGTISGPAAVCQSQTGYIYTVPVIANASTYNWILPAGATITNGATTNTITVSFSAVAVSGNITVQGINSCGNGTTSLNFPIIVSAGAAGNAGTISGTSPVCQGQSGVIYSVPVITNAVNYLWTLPGGATITSGDSTRSIIVSFSASAISGNIMVQASNSCGNGTVSAPFAVVVNTLPGTPGTITGTTPVCQNQGGYIYSVAAVGNASSYVWTLPTGATITSGSTTNSITVSFSGSAISGDISVQGVNSCGTGAASAPYTITVAPLPATPGVISGPISVCQNQGGYIFSVPAIANATSYVWTVPTGATITLGATTNSITVSFNGTAANGNITVMGVNSCGNGPVSAPFAVVVSSAGAGNAGTISGPNAVCQGQTGVVYTVAPITNAVIYTWILPAGATITSGNNTNTITVSFSASASAGNITVQGGNSCGNGAISPNFPITTSPLPATPGTINGTSPVCQGQSGIVYSVPAIANATSYVWTVPAGASIASGSTTNSITVDFNGAAASGNITVQGVNNCGNGPTGTFVLTISPRPAAAGLISGPISACKNQGGFVYTVPVIANATSYSWTVPAGATITSGSTTNSITVSFSGSAVSGNISVQGVNSCGSGLLSSNFIVIVSSAGAGNAGTINGTPVVCQGQTGVVYTVPVITNAVIYNWILPAGASITSGVNTNSITVTFDNNAQSGNITVQGSNSCGTGSVSAAYPVIVNVLPAAAGPITGPSSTCQNQTGNVYTVPTIPNVTSYQWTVPAGATITSASNGRTITVSFSQSAVGGTVSVTGVNSCGNGPAATFTVTVNETPTVNAVNNQTLCGNSPTTAVTFSGTVPGTTYNWTNNNTSIGLAAIGSGTINSFTAINTGTTTATATITITAVNNGCTGAQTSFTITVNAVPTATAGANSPLCIGDTINLTAQTISGATYSWTGPNSFSSTDQNPFIANSTVAMTGNYAVTASTSNCPSAPSIVNVVVNSCGSVDVSVVKTVNNTKPLVGQTVVFTLIATNNGALNATGVVVTDLLRSGYSFVSSSSSNFNPGTGAWTIGNLAAGTSQTLTITLRVNASGDYLNTATVVANEVEGNVVNNSSAAITYPTAFKIPGGFSPNGDGTNDLFVITGIEYYPSNNLVVFNRWGDKVYEIDSYNSSWNGDSNKGLRVGSNELPVGTYFYVLNLGDGSSAYKGTIYLSK